MFSWLIPQTSHWIWSWNLNCSDFAASKKLSSCQSICFKEIIQRTSTSEKKNGANVLLVSLLVIQVFNEIQNQSFIDELLIHCSEEKHFFPKLWFNANFNFWIEDLSVIIIRLIDARFITALRRMTINILINSFDINEFM